ncbi:MAG: class I SAM-dependent methyltransferase [Acidobacteria bacterium]|nr:class I SAM-dependent methyltransferase [Acidobacteriota bacterium]
MQDLADYILGFCSQTPEAHKYAETHLGRFIRSIEITPPGGPDDALLEMGAYMQMTPALGRLGYGEVRGSYLGPLGRVDDKSVTSTSGETFSCKIDLFNAESDRFPYEDGRFSTVVCCELIEHLSEDPMHTVAEVNRILKPGGAFVMSTPNICSMRSVLSVLTGYHPALFAQYTIRQGGNSVEPRHAREYAPRDVALLLEAGGFAVERLETSDQSLVAPQFPPWLSKILVNNSLPTDLRGDTIQAVGRKIGPVKDRYPEWLYT